MPSVDPVTLRAAAVSRGGVFLTKDATAAGFSAPMIRYRVATGQWIAVRRGAYVVAADVTDANQRHVEVAAALAVVGPLAAASHQSAARLLGVEVGRWFSPMIWLTREPTCRNGRHDLPGIIERAARLPPSDITIVDGLRCTSPARTIVDLGRHLAFGDATAYADMALYTKAVSMRELELVLTSQDGWPGVRRARRVFEFASGLAESPLESYSRVFFDKHGLPAPELQAVIRLDGSFMARVDFLWAEQHLIGEADGRMKYLAGDALWAEKRREDRLRGEGFEFVRWGWDDLFSAPRPLLAKLNAALARGSR